MPLYKSPEANADYISKFVRVETRIFITDPNNITTGHIYLARNEGLSMYTLRKETDPAQLDAGFVIFREGIIFPNGYSEGLELPVSEVAEEAREITIVEFARQSPNHQVVGNQDDFNRAIAEKTFRFPTTHT